MVESPQPLFRQVATYIEDLILDGNFAPGERVPSTNELAAFHSINPATARRGLSILADEGIVERRRGLGMFVTAGARKSIVERRRHELAGTYVAPLVDEAVRVGFARGDLHRLINLVAESRGMYS